jgi:hypothetical protein
MPYRRRAGGGKRDAAEKDILAALERLGARCWQLGGTSNPDVLISFRGAFYAAEIKTGNAGLTANQQDIPWPIFRSVEDAVAFLRSKAC